MVEKDIISLLNKIDELTLDILEPVAISAADKHEIETLYKKIGNALDRSFRTRVGSKGFVEQL